MMHLLKIEWLKLKNFRTFWVLSILFAVFLPLFNLMFSANIMNVGLEQILMVQYNFPNVWGNFGFWASWFVIFIAFTIVILITNEYRYRTNRQNIIDGWSRLDFFHAKVLLIFTLAFATTLYTMLWCFIFGLYYSGNLTGAFDQIEKMFFFLVLCLNYFGLAMMLSFLLKRSGLVIGIYMIYILMVENILQAWLNWQFTGKNIGDFLPLQSSDSLLPFSLMRMAKSFAGGASTYPSNSSFLMVSFGYILLYYFIARWRLMKSDW